MTDGTNPEHGDNMTESNKTVTIVVWTECEHGQIMFACGECSGGKRVEADTIQWCETHNSNFSEFYFDDGQISRCRFAQGAGLRRQCLVIVERLLVDPGSQP